MTARRVLITCRQMQSCIDEFMPDLAAQNVEVVMPEVVQQLTEAELIAIIGDFDGMIAGDDPLSERVLQHATRLRVISKWGVGMDGIDLDAARAMDIVVTNTPGVFGDSVADVAAGYLVMLARQLHQIDSSVRSGGWLKHEGRTLTGASLGVVGLGSIGQAVARRGFGFGMRVLGHDIVGTAQATAKEMGVEAVDLDALFRRAILWSSARRSLPTRSISPTRAAWRSCDRAATW